MLNSKNIYNFLSLLELNVFFSKKTFFLLKDSYFFIKIPTDFENSIIKKLISKSIYKNISITSLNTNVKKIKFPLVFYFFDKYNFFEDLFLNLFSNNLMFLFFKIKNKIFQFNSKCSPLVFNEFYSLKLSKLVTTSFFEILFFRFFFKI